MNVCANLSFMFHEAGPFISRYMAAASAGFRFIESDFPFQYSATEVGEALAQSKLTQVLLNCDQGKL